MFNHANRRSLLNSRSQNRAIRQGKATKIRPCRERSGRQIDSLEQRVLFSAIVVNTTAASGAGSLSAAIATANTAASDTTISFDPTVFATPQTITLAGTALELSNTAHSTTITGPTAGVTVNANSQSAVFIVDMGVTASISAFGVTGGSVGGIENNGSLTLANDAISGNSNENITNMDFTVTVTDGGGIDNAGSISLTNCTISGNSFTSAGDALTSSDHGGGGIYNGGTATLTNCTLTSNTIEDADEDTVGGGGIYNGGNATLTNCTISDNGHFVGIGGGGLDVGGGIYNSGTLLATGDNVSGNASYNDAGGIENTASATFTNCTIANNLAEDTGGGIENSSGALVLNSDTISLNQDNSGSDGIAVNDGTVTLGNTIVAGNTYPNNASNGDIVGNVISLGHNLIGVGDFASGLVSSDLSGTQDDPLSANLAALVNNGGPTQTMLPGNGPAVGGGSIAVLPAGTTTDQRGAPRTVNGKLDIGAVELQQAPGLSITNIASTGNVTAGSGATLSYVITVTNTGSTLATGVVVSDPLPAGLTFLSSTPIGEYSVSAGTWTIGDLSSGAQATLTIVADMTAGSGTLTTNAVVTSTSNNPNSAFNTASETVTVIPIAPVVADDAYTTSENVPLTVDAAHGVLANDTGGGPLTATLTGNPAGGTATLNPDGSFTFTPTPGLTNTGSFTYEASVAPNGPPSADATVTITVNGPTLASTTTLVTSNGVIGEGDSVTLTATVAPAVAGSQTPTGSVMFTAGGGIVLGSAQLASDGTATIATTALPVGTDFVTATYAGDGLYVGSESAAAMEIVGAFSTPISVGVISSNKQYSAPPITLLNGTVVKVTVAGGAGTLTHVGNEIDLTLSGTPKVTFHTKGGENSFTLYNVTAASGIRSLIAPTANLTGTLTVPGTLSTLRLNDISGSVIAAGGIARLNAGNVSGSVSVAGILGNAKLAAVSGVIAAAKINTLSATTFSDAQILAGVTLGSDGLLGGVGTAADTYSAGQILALHVSGPVTDSIIAAGAGPGTDGVFGTSDDTLANGLPSRIGSISTKGNVDSMTRFESAMLPKIVHIPGRVVTGGDGRFVVLG
ncbi:MAG TPA: Ig-like domain repeat protein [Tepidisphaeraceae bacterium]|jgi:uncharacterized repeat protein (TIGR01451 family)|nr:Ig-like domain repeat protein [Tepidisphaeraceae bacterium]